MIQAPGLLSKADKEKLFWVADVQIMLKTGWTQEQLDDTPVVTKRRMMTYLNGEARAHRQMQRKPKK